MRDFSDEEIKTILLSGTIALDNMIKEQKAEPIRIFNERFIKLLGEQFIKINNNN